MHSWVALGLLCELPARCCCALHPACCQVFIRHGDRTDAGPQECWPNDQADWPCHLKQNQATSTSPDKISTTTVDRVYRLTYVPGLESEGGCAGTGQLTERGYEQQLSNGEHLRDAYVTAAGLLPEVRWFARTSNTRVVGRTLMRRVLSVCSRTKIARTCFSYVLTTVGVRKCQDRPCSRVCTLRKPLLERKREWCRSGPEMSVRRSASVCIAATPSHIQVRPVYMFRGG